MRHCAGGVSRPHYVGYAYGLYLYGYLYRPTEAVAGFTNPLTMEVVMKSHASNQVSLAHLVYRDACARCVAVQPDLRDEMTISSRVLHEGISFLTIALPIFGKDFERSLSEGCIGPTTFQSFRKVGRIPAFLQGIVSHVFDRGTGKLLDKTLLDVECVGAVRQIAYCFKKLELDCTEERVQAALDGFVRTERDLSEAIIQDEDTANFLAVSNLLWDIFTDVNVFELVPSHGPGATVEGVCGNAKYSWERWHERLEQYFPLLDTAYTLGGCFSRELENVTFVRVEDEAPVKVTCVPKTQKGPRIIAIEPCCMQYTQQSVRKELYDLIERSPLSAGHVNFRDQSVNRDLAMSASRDGRLATIDLSDASDRVLCDLAIRMFDCNPDLQGAILSCRSTHAKLPDGTIIGPLKKFASMGSALCFPVEAMYFYTICVVALIKAHNLPVTRRNIRRVSRDVYVYGDDILVPSTYATIVVDYLQKYHCKVNMLKSYWSGSFRESCGMDAYDGVEVTPTYIKCLHPDNKRQARELISWVETANFFYVKGYVNTSLYMFNIVERILGELPVVHENSPALGRILQAPLSTGKWNKALQRSEVRAWTAEPIRRTDRIGGYGALMKCLLIQRQQPETVNYITDTPRRTEGVSTPLTRERVQVSDHLKRSALHGAVTLKRRWVPVN